MPERIVEGWRCPTCGMLRAFEGNSCTGMHASPHDAQRPVAVSLLVLPLGVETVEDYKRMVIARMLDIPPDVEAWKQVYAHVRQQVLDDVLSDERVIEALRAKVEHWTPPQGSLTTYMVEEFLAAIREAATSRNADG